MNDRQKTNCCFARYMLQSNVSTIGNISTRVNTSPPESMRSKHLCNSFFLCLISTIFAIFKSIIKLTGKQTEFIPSDFDERVSSLPGLH